MKKWNFLFNVKQSNEKKVQKSEFKEQNDYRKLEIKNDKSRSKTPKKQAFRN